MAIHNRHDFYAFAAFRLANLISAALSRGERRAIRSRTQMSQAVFAAILNTSVSTVQKWEIGEKRPSGPSLKLLNVIERKGVKALA